MEISRSPKLLWIVIFLIIYLIYLPSIIGKEVNLGSNPENLNFTNIKIPNITILKFPDIVIERERVYPYPPSTNTTTIIQAVIKNIGQDEVSVTNPFITELYIDNKLEKTWKFPVNEEESSLKPFGVRLYSYDVKYNKSGKHHFRWVADSNSQVAEKNEDNNELDYIEEWHTPSDLPDIIIDDIYNEGSLLVGIDTKFYIRIKNVGYQPVTYPFLVNLKSDGVQFAAFTCDYLGIGEEKTFESYPVHLSSPGKDVITGAADAGNVIKEKDENNNELTKDFSIIYQAPSIPIDLTRVINGVKPVSGIKDLLVIFWNPHRPDHKAAPKNVIENSLNGPTPSVNDYFIEESGGLFKINAICLGYYDANKPWDHYANHPSTPCAEGFLNGHVEKWAEAIRKADKDFDFKKYDINKNRLLERNELPIFIFIPQNEFAGFTRPVVGMEYPEKKGLFVDGDETNGVKIPEVTEIYANSVHIGFFAHELSHALLNTGDMYLDFYDASYCGDHFQPYYSGPYSLMDMGNGHLDPIHKLKLGWLKPIFFKSDGWYNIRNIGTHYEVAILSDPQRTDKEYFIVENRWPNYLWNVWPYAYDDRKGLAVWHVIEDEKIFNNLPTPPDVNTSVWHKDAGWQRNGIRMIRPIYEDRITCKNLPNQPKNNWSLWDGSDPKTGYDLLSIDPNPAHATLKWADGSPSGFSIQHIPASSSEMEVYISKKGTNPTNIWINGPNFFPAPGEPFLIEGVLMSTSTLPGATIWLERSKDGLSFEKIGSATSDNHGKYYFWQTENDNGSYYYRTSYPGSSTYYIAISNPVKVDVILRLNEALDNQELKWIVGGADGWTGTTKTRYYGMGSAKSGSISDGQKSILITQVEGPGTMQFMWATSSEQNGDWLQFYVDGMLKDQISGEVSFRQNTCQIGPGKHQLTWQYSKNNAASVGKDAGWLDRVEWISSKSLGEALDNTNLTWETFGKALWFAQSWDKYYGPGAAQTGDIDLAGNTSIKTNIKGPGSLKFYWKVSSENHYGILSFFDNNSAHNHIAGDLDWTQETYNLGPDNHEIKWSYERAQGSGTSGLDAAWLDKVEWIQAQSLGKALDNMNLTWTTGGGALWFMQNNTFYYDSDAAQSGAIRKPQCTWLKTVVIGPGEISFWWKVSSLPKYNQLSFYIDNRSLKNISGDFDWNREKFNIDDGGEHLLEWRYCKRENVDRGPDAGWIDKVEWEYRD